jgi:hypothetical protein
VKEIHKWGGDCYKYTCEVSYITKIQEEWRVYIALLGTNPWA